MSVLSIRQEWETITGRAQLVADIKAGISKQVKIEDLGKLSCHLGVDYKFGHDEHGHYILSSMNEYHESMVRDFEKDIGSSLKTFSTPGAAVTPHLRGQIHIITLFTN